MVTEVMGVTLGVKVTQSHVKVMQNHREIMQSHGEVTREVTVKSVSK